LTPLETLAQRVRLNFGLVRVMHLKALRAYIDERPESDIIREIENFETMRNLKILLEAKPKGRLYWEIAERAGKLI